MAGGPGFEPGLRGSEPRVLPLNYPPNYLPFLICNLPLVKETQFETFYLCFRFAFL